VHSAPERAKEEKRRDKYSIRESEGEKIVQKDEETDKDGKTAEREENTAFKAMLAKRVRSLNRKEGSKYNKK